LLPGANAERFVTEAKITAKLPHPGIPPVHALGTLDDGTPWLAMKLIRGQTLAELLKKRSSPRDDLPRFIQVFEQICQAVGFAHSRGILHRDLKPLNVMVGEFGEVQVMDWGLAKDTTSRQRQLTGDAGEPDDSRRRLEDAGNVQHTAAGTIMGTPGYMAPEQARGEPVDARADVFAPGSILAAILTGQPAFVGTSKYETIAKAASADLADVLARLDACGADAELLAIARRCLAANAEERFADGREVASAVAAYRATVEARLRQAETAAAEALVKNLTGGDRVAARFVRGEWFEFAPHFKIFLATNHKPRVGGTDDAIWDRLRLVPFAVRIPDEERRPLEDLLADFAAEMPGILAWALRGCLEWQRDGLGTPHGVREATARYREEMDVLGMFLAECCRLDPAERVSSHDLYEEYKRWAVEVGERVWSHKQFTQGLEQRGVRDGFRKQHARAGRRHPPSPGRLGPEETGQRCPFGRTTGRTNRVRRAASIGIVARTRVGFIDAAGESETPRKQATWR